MLFTLVVVVVLVVVIVVVFRFGVLCVVCCVWCVVCSVWCVLCCVCGVVFVACSARLFLKCFQKSWYFENVYFKKSQR